MLYQISIMLLFLLEISGLSIAQKVVSQKSTDPNLTHLLDSLAGEDQKWRALMVDYENGKLKDSTITSKTISRNCFLTDSLNYFNLEEIFSKYGFPGYDLVGSKGSNDFWLLVQHQDKHPSFQDSVLTTMKIAVDAKKASASNYAYLIDRVKVNTGQLQIYGTQLMFNSDTTSFTPEPVIDPKNLNERRKSMGLDSIEKYIWIVNHNFGGSLKK